MLRYVRCKPPQMHQLSCAADLKLALRWAMGYFFCLNCGHYVLRPLRDELVLHYELHQLPYFFTGTFIVMVFLLPLLSRLVKEGTHWFLKASHGFFITNLICFCLFFELLEPSYYLHLAFFVWLSIFNLLSVSLFWSFMTDLLDVQQSKIFFARIALAGSLGAIVGSVIAFVWALLLPVLSLMFLAILMLLLVLRCIYYLQKPALHLTLKPTKPIVAAKPVPSSTYYLRQIALLVLLYTFLSTFLYFEQAQLLAYSQSNTPYGGLNRTAILALMALVVNGITLLIQFFLTRFILMEKGIIYALTVVPSLMIICLISLSFAPVLLVLVISQIVHKTGNYALMRPARESLFALIAPARKYKVKMWIDLVVYRGGDVLGGWIFFALLRLVGLDIETLTLLIIPIAYLWQWQSRKVGRLHERLLKP